MKESLRYLTTINVGKNGITDSVIEEIKLLLKKKKVLRVKFLKSFMEEAKQKTTKKQLFEDLAKRTNSKIEKAVGFVLVLKKK